MPSKASISKLTPVDKQKHSQSLVPVTALHLTKLGSQRLLLAGQGTGISVIDPDTSKVLYFITIFGSQAIHGILCTAGNDIPPSMKCVVWGGKSLVFGVLQSEDDSIILRRSTKEEIAPDWILDLCFLDVKPFASGEEQQRAVLLTSHNVIYLSQATKVFAQDLHYNVHFRALASGPSSMLYSGSVAYHGPKGFLIAAGTVFGEIHLWSCNPCDSDESIDANGRLLYTFKGHEGSIFGVCISSSWMRSSNHQHCTLTSCSDDRTIRVWNISRFCNPNGLRETEESRSDTGPANTSATSLGSQDCAISLTTAHLSRIWGICYISCSENEQYMASFGEDAAICLWCYRFAQGTQGATLELIHRKSHHSGKNIWSLAIGNSTSKVSMISGGADGQIILSTPALPLLAQKQLSSHLFAASVPQSLAKKAQDSKGETESPTAELTFQALQGIWKLNRVLKSRLPAYPSGTFLGSASIVGRDPTAPGYQAESVYKEEGTFTTDQGFTLQGSRSYIYRYQKPTNSLTAWFVKVDEPSKADYLFHQVGFTSSKSHGSQRAETFSACGSHLCIKDNYDATYKFNYKNASLQSWSLRYDVKGPSKDYYADASFTPIQKPATHEAMETAKPVLVREIQDSFRAFCWLDSREILATTAQGLVLLGTLDLDLSQATAGIAPGDLGNLTWTPINQIDNLRSFSIMTRLQGGQVFVGGGNLLYSYHKFSRSINLFAMLPQKAVSLFSQQVPGTSSTSSDTIGIIAPLLSKPVAQCFLLRSEEPRLESHELRLPPHFVVTSMMFRNETSIILGSRHGALSFHDLASIEIGGELSPAHCIRGVHGQDAVTTILEAPSNSSISDLLILTTGRDGRFAMHKIFTSGTKNEAIQFSTIHALAPPFGPGIEGAIFDQISLNLLLWGFRGKDFVLWNANHQKEVMTVRCGGANRSHCFNPNNDGKDGGRFLWTEASTCCIQTQDQASHQILQPGFHGREVKAIAVSPTPMRCGGDSIRLLASGAEDTEIRVSSAPRSGQVQEIRCLGVISHHNTGIQALKWSSSGRFLFSSGGREELYVWRIHPIPFLEIGILLAAQCPLITESEELRVTGIDLLELERGAEGERFLISAIYSDSSCRIWFYDSGEQDSSFQLQCSSIYSTCCITHVKFIRLEDRVLLLTAATDGYIALWKLDLKLDQKLNLKQGMKVSPASDSKTDALPEMNRSIGNMECLIRHRVHQSNIQCMVVVPAPNEALVLTSGDDNALAISSVVAGKQGIMPEISTTQIPRAHAAAIASISILEQQAWSADERVAGVEIASIGKDQKIKKWDISFDSASGTRSIHLCQVQAMDSSVADASCTDILDTDSGKFLLVAGIGIELWSLK